MKTIDDKKENIYKMEGYSMSFQTKTMLKEYRFPLKTSSIYYVFPVSWLMKWRDYVLGYCLYIYYYSSLTTMHPGIIQNKDLLISNSSSKLNCTPMSSSTLIAISNKFTLDKERINEGDDYIIMPNIIAYLLISIYGIDVILKTKRKHLFNNCQNDENCSYCSDLWSKANTLNRINVINLYRAFQESYLKSEEDQKLKEITLKSSSESSSSSSSDITTKYEKRFLFRFFSC